MQALNDLISNLWYAGFIVLATVCLHGTGNFRCICFVLVLVTVCASPIDLEQELPITFKSLKKHYDII